MMIKSKIMKSYHEIIIKKKKTGKNPGDLIKKTYLT